MSQAIMIHYMLSLADRIYWQRLQNTSLTEIMLTMEDGTEIIPDRMKRPFIYEEDGESTVSCVAVRKGDESRFVFISENQMTLWHQHPAESIINCIP